MRLNLGCGNKKIPGYIGVDKYGEAADINCDLMGFEPENGPPIEEIVMFHVIEHFTQGDGIELLSRCHRWLEPGGKLVIETPERDKALKLVRSGKEHHFKRKVWRPLGLAVLIGGEHGREDEIPFYDWMRFNRERIAFHVQKTGGFPPDLIPEEFRGEPGINHRFIWKQNQLADCMRIAGFKTTIKDPETHARRKNRDFRIEGVKL